MTSTLLFVAEFVADATVRFAPLFALSVGIAAVLQHLDVTAAASDWLRRRDGRAVLAGTVVGTFSPLCSCTVVPAVRGLLLAGAPLGGVMAFWIASPLMDPEIFVLTVGLLGWELAVARLVAALSLSLGAGALAVVALRRGWFGLRDRRWVTDPGTGPADGCDATCDVAPAPVVETCCSTGVGDDAPRTGAARTPGGGLPLAGSVAVATPVTADVGADQARPRGIRAQLRELDRRAVLATLRSETVTIGRWILAAFVLEALIVRFVPQETLVALLGSDTPWAIPAAAVLGIPLYLNNLSALPLVAGLVEQGMAPGAAIAFLVAGPVTTVPAMTAVRALVAPSVFRLYVVTAVVGSVVLGLAAGLVL